MRKNTRPIILAGATTLLIAAGAALLRPSPAQAEGTLHIYGGGTQGETCMDKCEPQYLCCKITIVKP
jgi:hypothetical protein